MDMDDPSEGCYCVQAQACPHWITSKMDDRLSSAKAHSHQRTKTFEQERLEDQRPIVSELQRELRAAMEEIEKLAQMSRDLAKINQELEESRLLAISDQNRTSKRLLLMSSQLEYTEQKVVTLTKELDEHNRDANQLRIERMRRETLQQREDAGRLRIDTLEDELEECQRSERSLQQKLSTLQGKFETLTKRHENLKRQQQELELARESKEALAWLKETTDRLCSPPNGGLGIGPSSSQDRSFQGSSAHSLHQSSPSSSPPYPSSLIDPPLAAQNQLISLIKELATANSTLRSELGEYRDLLQDSRNEVLTLRTQVEDYEQGHVFEDCCGSRIDDTASDSLYTSKSAWSHLDIAGGGLDAVSHIGTLGSAPGSPPPFMTAPSRHHHHIHRHYHGSVIRGNVFGELERLYSQGSQGSNHTHRPSKRRTSQEHDRSRRSGTPNTTTGSSSVSRKGSTPMMNLSRSPPNPTPSKLRDQYDPTDSPVSSMDKSRRSYYSDQDVRDSSEESERDPAVNPGFSFHDGHLRVDSDGSTKQTRFVPKDNTDSAVLAPISSSTPPQLSAALLPSAPMDETLLKTETENPSAPTTEIQPTPEIIEVPLKNRASSISLLSAELQKATRTENKENGLLPRYPVEGPASHPLDVHRPGSNSVLEQDETVQGHVRDSTTSTTPTTTTNTASAGFFRSNKSRFMQHEKAASDQGWRQRRRLSEPLHHLPSSNSITAKKSRPGSIYSLRKPRPRLESSETNHQLHHSSLGYYHPGHGHGHFASGSVGCLPELQRCKSAEMVEQIISERRHRMMEAWRVGVVAAAVTQQQSIHSVVAFGDHSTTNIAAKDTDSISIRSRASRASRRTKSGGRKVQQEPTLATIDAALPIQESATMMTTTTSSVSKDTLTELVAESEIKKGSSDKDETFQPTSPHREATLQEGEKTPTFGAKKAKTPKAGKRMSVRSRKSVRSSVLYSPMQRSPQQSGGARDRRFPSEASTASEAFSNRRLDQEHSPYQLLHTLSTDLLERLARSDTRELNRRLKRTFDIQALSQMSNSVIENVLTDVNNLGERFRWVEAQVASPMDEMLFGQNSLGGPKVSLSGAEMENALADSDIGLEDREKGQLEGLSDDEETDSEASMDSDWGFSVEEFFPLAHVVQEMLSEIGKLRMTINELQLSYVQKVEQDRIKAEKDFMDGDSVDEGGYDSDDEKEDGHFDNHQQQHHNHHRQQHLHERMEKEKKATAATAAAAAQHQKTVLGMLDRPRILGAASTGVSGFFNKVFGGSEKAAARSEDAKADSAAEKDKDTNKTVLTRSKSGVVIAETSRIFAQSAWLSSPRDTKTPKRASTLESGGISEVKESVTSALTFGPSKLSATTSLTAMAVKSPARSSTIAVGSATVSRIGAMDIRFGSGVRQTDSSVSSTTTTAQGLLSRSLPQSATFMTRPLEDELAEAGSTTIMEDAISRTSLAPASLKSLSSLPEDRVSDPQTPPVNTSDAAAGSSSSQTPYQPSNGISMSKTPRSMGISTRTSGPALNVVTKHDVFQEHWPSSLASSLSATISSTTLSEKRLSSNSKETALSAEPNGRKNNRAPSMESHSSASTGGEVAVSSLASRLGVITGGVGSAKPTLISRSTLAVATPSTSTVSSPMSATSWFDTRRSSGGLAPDLQSSTETGHYDGSLSSVQDVRSTIHGAGASGDQAVTASLMVTATATTRKARALTSFHASAANGGSTESAATRSLGRAAGRESALAFLRGEGQATASSLLGSFFQQPDNHNNNNSNNSNNNNGTISASDRLRSSILKGKTPIYDSQPNSTKASFEILNKDGYDDLEEGEYRAAEAEKDYDPQQQLHTQAGIMSSSRSDTSLLQATLSSTTATAPSTPLLMRVAGAPNTPTTPTTSITQRNAPTSSTAVAYVVAVPDHEEGGSGSGSGAGSNRLRRAVFDRDLIKASQKRILAQVPHHNPNVPQNPSVTSESLVPGAAGGGGGSGSSSISSQTQRPFEPQAKPRRARALSVDSSQSVEPLKATEIMDIWRVGAGVSRDIWRGLIKKVDGREA